MGSKSDWLTSAAGMKRKELREWCRSRRVKNNFTTSSCFKHDEWRRRRRRRRRRRVRRVRRRKQAQHAR